VSRAGAGVPAPGRENEQLALCVPADRDGRRGHKTQGGRQPAGALLPADLGRGLCARLSAAGVVQLALGGGLAGDCGLRLPGRDRYHLLARRGREVQQVYAVGPEGGVQLVFAAGASGPSRKRGGGGGERENRTTNCDRCFFLCTPIRPPALPS